MKNKTKGLIIDLCALVLWILAFASMGFNAVVSLNESVLRVVIFSVLGLIINYLLCVAFHEMGHIIFAKAKKMKCVRANLGFLSVEYTERKKIKLFTLFGENAGESSFLPTKKFDEQTVKTVAFGGILFNFIYLLGVFAVILWVKNPVIYCLFGAGGVSAGYLLTVNAIPLDKTSDGALILFKNGYARAVATITEMQRCIINNEEFVLPEYVSKSNQPLDIYCNFFYTASSDAKTALNLLKPLENNFDFTPQEYELIFPEILFNACIGGLLSEEIKNRAENFYSNGAKTLSETRAHYAYRKTLGENDWATAILTDYNKKLNCATSYEKAVENNLFKLI